MSILFVYLYISTNLYIQHIYRYLSIFSSISLYLYLSIYLFIYISISLFIYLSNVYISICLFSLYISISLHTTYLSLFVYLFVHFHHQKKNPPNTQNCLLCLTNKKLKNNFFPEKTLQEEGVDESKKIVSN